MLQVVVPALEMLLAANDKRLIDIFLAAQQEFIFSTRHMT